VLTGTDVDNGSTVFWTTLGGPLYGFATVNANGQWTYTLDNTRFQTQQLGQGQPVIDTFTVRAVDQFGAFDTGSEQEISVTVVGTNDRPNLPPVPLALSVAEDGTAGFGTTSAFDIDNGNLLHWSLNRDGALGYSSPYEFRADSFRIVKNGADLFFDDFTAGGPPPQAPNFLLPPPPGGSAETFYTASSRRPMASSCSRARMPGPSAAPATTRSSSATRRSSRPTPTRIR
jgi:VCBS repeat-containing protein